MDLVEFCSFWLSRHTGRTQEVRRSGLIAQLSAAYDERDRTREWTERHAARALEREEEATDAEIDGLCELVEAYVSARLLADGYYRHHRGEWRLRRNSGERKANSADE